MSFVLESCAGIEFIAFRKEGSNGVVRKQPRIGLASNIGDFEKIIHDRTVQAPDHSISLRRCCWIDILWNWHLRLLGGFYELIVRDSYRLNARLGDQVKAMPQFDHRTNHRWIRESTPGIGGPLEGSNNVTLPKVDPCTEPIVVALACLKRGTTQERMSGPNIASVITKYDRHWTIFLSVSL